MAATRAVPDTVLYVHQGRDWIRGSERCLLDLLAHVDRARVRPIVACTSAVLGAAVRELGVVADVSDEWGEQPTREARTRSAARVDALLAREHVRLVHANESFGTLPWLMGAARARRVPIVAHLHNPSTSMDRCQSWLHQVAHVAGSSEAAVRGTVADGMPPARVSVVYNAVDPVRLEEGDARGLRASLGIPADAVVFTAVGSHIARKGIDVLLRATALARRSTSSVRVLVLSDGPDRAELERLAGELGLLDGTVHFAGMHPYAGAVLRDASDVVVSAARAETFGISLIEGALFARPALASDIDGHREAVVRDVTGLLVPADDAAALASGMVRLAGDASLRTRLGAAARARVLDGFLVDRYVRDFATIYDALLARPRAEFGWTGEWRWPRVYWGWVRSAVHSRVVRRHRSTPG